VQRRSLGDDRLVRLRLAVEHHDARAHAHDRLDQGLDPRIVRTRGLGGERRRQRGRALRLAGEVVLQAGGLVGRADEHDPIAALGPRPAPCGNHREREVDRHERQRGAEHHEPGQLSGADQQLESGDAERGGADGQDR